MSGKEILDFKKLTVGPDVDVDDLMSTVNGSENLRSWQKPVESDVTVEQFDQQQQDQWYMPDHYRSLDIAEYVLSCCIDDAELQRAGQELLLFQQRDMFDLLRYLKYLVDTMQNNDMIWGVGRGSAVASFVLYKLGVHRINSLYYDLDPGEFLR